MVNSINKVFEIDDLRRYILNFLRKEPKRKCKNCNCVLVWDKKVNEYISYKPQIKIEYALAAGLVYGDYCINCWASNGPFSSYFCTIS